MADRPAPAAARRRAASIFDRLDQQHPNATTELDFRNPFELLVATILSAQSTDVRVNQVTPGPWTESLRHFLRHPVGMIGTDSTFVAEKPSPRTYGSYPRVLGQFVREEGLLGLEEAVRHMTGAPAARLGLPDRGLIRDGYAADLVVFDPERVRSNATYEEPRRFPDGIEGEMFFQKRIPTRGVPDWIKTAKIKFPSMRTADELSPADLAHVAWAAQMGTVVFHPWPVRADAPDEPDELRIDLDPQPGTGFTDVVATARVVREVLKKRFASQGRNLWKTSSRR